jgi:periplasmic divalent cation tolerance protein
MEKETFSMVITTCGSKSDAEEIATALLAQQLAACIQVFPITSYYTWKGEQAIDDEQVLFIKSKSDLYPQIEGAIRQHHKYEVPEIIQVPITNGLPAYLSWINEVSAK